MTGHLHLAWYGYEVCHDPACLRHRERGLTGLPDRHEAAWQALQDACEWEEP